MTSLILLTVIIDSEMTRETALNNRTFPSSIVAKQEVVTVRYYGFDNKLHQGQIVVDKRLSTEIKLIFQEIETAKFPIKKVVPIVKYDWSDSKSISDNNTSAFNYRFVDGTNKLSDHAFGQAVDINPYLNPYVLPGKKTRPYNPKTPGTITKSTIVYKAFIKRGWQWGGDWKNGKDYQHFYKRLSNR